jgi:hypothetical protein
MQHQLPILSLRKRILALSLIYFVFLTAVLTTPRLELTQVKKRDHTSVFKGGQLSFHAILEKDLKQSPSDSTKSQQNNTTASSYCDVCNVFCHSILSHKVNLCRRDNWEAQKIRGVLQKQKIFPFHCHW